VGLAQESVFINHLLYSKANTPARSAQSKICVNSRNLWHNKRRKAQKTLCEFAQSVAKPAPQGAKISGNTWNLWQPLSEANSLAYPAIDTPIKWPTP
jgi:hypothetical protein